MKEYLVFRLYGPMASWGDIAVGEARPSRTRPSKSAVLGLVAAALGIPRDEEETHRTMAECYGFALRVDTVGTPLVDYHTAQVPPGRKGFLTRREEVTSVPRNKLVTILSNREYRTDAMYTVALWEKTTPAPFSLATIVTALRHPKYTLYLGRKSCPLALPMEPKVVRANSLTEGFQHAVFSDIEELHHLPSTGESALYLYWEEGGEAGIAAQHVYLVRDEVLSRRRWQFDVRSEYHSAYGEDD